MSVYRIEALAIVRIGAHTITNPVPTFYLKPHEREAGIVDSDHAMRIATLIINAGGDENMTVKGHAYLCSEE